MPRYINENEIYALFNRRGQALLHVGDIDVLPRADAVEVVHGRWIELGSDDTDDFRWKCSNCNEVRFEYPGRDNYCPNCGAKMDEKVEHADE